MRTIVSTGKSAVDRAIGARLRSSRLNAGLSQSELGDALGVTFQQIQKYEKGINRVSGARLITLCQKLRMTPDQLLGTGTKSSNGADTEASFEALYDRHVARMVAAIGTLSPRQRQAVATAVIELVRAFGTKV